MGAGLALTRIAGAILAAAAALGGAGSAAAQTSTATSTASFEPPRPLTPTTIAYPEDAPRLEAPVRVGVVLRIDAEGEVIRVELVDSSSVAALDRAVLEGATRFRFAPARLGGAPVSVDVRFGQTFEPPAAPPPPVLTATVAQVRTATTGPRFTGVIAGRLDESGTRRPVAYAPVTLTCEALDLVLEARSDERGIFALRVPKCRFRIEVRAPGFERFRQSEWVDDFQRLEVGYILVRRTLNPYEVTVYGERKAEEISRVTLRDREVRQIPGTFGDPFRVVQTLPGVSNMVSLLPFPIVRGSSPGNTGFLVDGVRVPLLFHLLAGPSVIHPEFIDEIDFMPGAYSVEHGGYTGGIVNGRTRRAGPEDDRIEASFDFVQTGLFVRKAIPSADLAFTAAGRYGYPGLLISLIDPDNSLSYWDYQARIDYGDKASGWSLFAFGANDTFSSAPEPGAPKETTLRLQFHRVDLRYERQDTEGWDRYQVSLGFDETTTDGGVHLKSLSATPQLRWSRKLASTVEGRMSLEGLARQNSTIIEEPDSDTMMVFDRDTPPEDELFAARWSAEALWRPHPRVLVRPGVRMDVYDNGQTLQAGVDPRLLWRWRIGGTPQRPLALKGGVGVYHQPPRFVVPLPGFDQIAFERGLIESIQTSVGIEVPFEHGFEVDVQGYYNHMDPLVFDLSVNPDTIVPGFVEEGEVELRSAKGRAYGLEVLLRRRSANGIFGWISYTLSRSERDRFGEWVAFDFDRTHIFNAVLGIPLPRGWSIGMRALIQSGRPVSTTRGANTARTDPFVRFDIRIDKRAAWRNWLLEFYVDVNNLALSPEEIDAGNGFRYVLPTLGFRAIF